MKKLLPEYGCNVAEIPKLENDSNAVSATAVLGNFYITIDALYLNA